MAFGDFTVTRASTKNVLGSAGLYVSVANNVPAFEFNTNGTYRGLLVEPGATCQNQHSNDITQAYWNKINLTPTQTTDAKFQGFDVTRLVDSVDVSAVGHAFTRISGELYLDTTTNAFNSIFVKNEAGVRYVHLSLRGTNDGANLFATAGRGVTFDLQSGVVTAQQSGAVGFIEPVGDGWYRLGVHAATIDTGNQTNRRFQFAIIGTPTPSSNATMTYQGDGTKSCLVAFSNAIRDQTVFSSPIVTTAGTASRVADVVSLTGASSLIGQTGGGTLFVEVDWREVGTQVLTTISNNTTQNRLRITVASGELRMFCRSNNVEQTNQGQSTSGYSGIQKVAFRYEQNNAKLYRNGSSISTDTTFDISALASLTQVNIGSSEDGTQQANMWIRAVALFPTPLADAQLASITTL